MLKDVSVVLKILLYSVVTTHCCQNRRNGCQTADNYTDHQLILVKKWAPLIWLAPGEEFLPSSTKSFLEHVVPFMPSTWFHDQQARKISFLPTGSESQQWFLKTFQDVDKLLFNKSSILYGENPNKESVPVYTHLTNCKKQGHFQVTFWLFYPYNRGKEVCTLNTLMGVVPIPRWLNGQCLGLMKEFGNHVGDWEHVSLNFKGKEHPAEMYVSVHSFGSYYKFDETRNQFILHGRMARYRPQFPKTVNLIQGSHPVLFAAKGSHGLWATPGRHKYVNIPSLYDESGYGVKWTTWKSLKIIKDFNSGWLRFQGRWGNPREKCFPLSNTICQLVDGPTGIPMKKLHFTC
ncbi:LOW QUALITY PROTEIN: putative vacuolar protein sorting-associated protein TDA6 [Nilaparvata lugens]|uniref:LOW QUALITY PROTEIN: putative vacuolar protein sorting-associated protein TDA6 n=1 Tax=Nilaparvata lugens TaxID=108931 RepID=UPI00193E0AE1|nr:LOW QUALITY PROTEIN: putative vacuolar protein sorting-associated protein TDA6 [Nilaparvata lugens]